MRHAPIDPELFAANRRRLVPLLPPKAVAIVHAADILPTTGDGTLKLHPASDLFWLAGIEQEESVLLLCPQASDPAARELLFVRQPNERLATWEGEKLTKEKARAISGIATVRWLTELPGALHVMEYELEAELLREFTRRRARMAYEPIIGSGHNACVLHYLDNNAECRAGDLVLVDVGASYANYSADLTRTYPVSGRFTERQRAVYEAVLRVLESSIARCVPGVSLRDWKRAAQVQMAGELVGLGLITADEAAKDTPEEPACKKYFMHGLGHSLGLGVHDIAPVDGPLEPGWVITVEPGIYIPEENLAVRLENDVLVTEQGPVDLCSQVPIQPDEIERLLARGE